MVANGRSYSDQFPQSTLAMQFLDLTSSDSILAEAKREGILSESTYKSIISLQREESNNFVSKTNIVLENKVEHKVEYTASAPSKALRPEKVGYFMNRFIVKWNLSKQNACTSFSMNNSNQFQDFGEERWNFAILVSLAMIRWPGSVTWLMLIGCTLRHYQRERIAAVFMKKNFPFQWSHEQ